jgi:cobalt-zinc-cadmium efflux system membrane fusion protein
VISRRSLIILLGVAAGGVFAAGTWHRSAGMRDRPSADPTAGLRESPAGHTTAPAPVRAGRDELIVPPELVRKMGLKTAVAAKPTEPVSLPAFQGVLALDNDCLSRVHSRFEGEIVEMGKSTDGSDPAIRVGEHVQAGDLLAVIWSTELGKKKSELVEALSKLRSETELRDRLKKLYEAGAGSGRSYRDAEKDVETRTVEVAGIERTLRTWRLTDRDLDEIRDEAQASGDRMHAAAPPANWARFEVRAPSDGVILEKNIVVGDLVDTTTDLFKIGRLDQLAVWVHVYEEDLPLLESLPKPIQWTISLPARPGETFTGTLDKIGAMIDPAQHTALVTGRVRNPGSTLRVGQFVTITVRRPPGENEIEVPSTAVIEDGHSSVVFVQSGDAEGHFHRQEVGVLRRLREQIFVDATTSGVRAGDLVVTSGALLLQNAMDQLPPGSAEAVAGVTSDPTSDEHVPG